MRLENGDIVIADTDIFIKHYGVTFRDREGKLMVMHNTPQKSVSIDTWDSFFIDRTFNRIIKTPCSGMSYNKIMSKYNEVKYKKYSIIDFDCEDFTEHITGCKIKIRQAHKYTKYFILAGLSVLFKLVV